jgi:hypothetical protein
VAGSRGFVLGASLPSQYHGIDDEPTRLVQEMDRRVQERARVDIEGGSGVLEPNENGVSFY